jgi:UDP:flavonoid glycosyltransferase YjiC (YdhE family)
VAAALGIPCIAVDTSPSIPRKLHAVSNLRALARLRQDAGLTPDIAQEWLEAVPHLSFYPPSLDLAAPGPLTRRARYDVFDRFPGGLSDAVLAMVDDPRPIVLATLGTIFNRRGVMPELATALGNADWNVVLAAGRVVEEMDLGDLAPNVIAAPWIPFSEILPHCSAAVHHGGTNTTLAVAAAGIPSVVVPLGADQFHNAVAVAGAGVGRVVLENSGHRAELREATKDVLANPIYRLRADALRKEISAMPALSSVMPAMIAAALVS